MSFVEHIDLIFAGARRHHDLFAQVTDIVDTSIRGGIYLDDVEGVTRGNLAALQAFVALLAVFRVATIYRFCQQTRSTGFTVTSWSGIAIGMFYIVAVESIFERTNSLLLTMKIINS